MPPKRTASASRPKKAAPQHASYQDMIKEAIIYLKERTGSSRQALKTYVRKNNNLEGVSDTAFTTQFNRALLKGTESGVFARPKGPSGPVKLAKPTKTAEKPAPKSTKAKSTTTKAATRKAPAKKTSTTKTVTKKTPAKNPAPTAKANTGKARKTAKTPTTAPAVEEKASVVLGTTKSGRITKSKAPLSGASTSKPGKKVPARKATKKKS